MNVNRQISDNVNDMGLLTGLNSESSCIKFFKILNYNEGINNSEGDS